MATQEKITTEQFRAPKTGRNKYGRKRVCVDGEWFDSQLEANVCRRLRVIHGKENVVRQPSLPIGDQRIRPDFMVVLDRGVSGGRPVYTVQFHDAKGHETPESKAKRNCLKALHGIDVELER